MFFGIGFFMNFMDFAPPGGTLGGPRGFKINPKSTRDSKLEPPGPFRVNIPDSGGLLPIFLDSELISIIDMNSNHFGMDF